MRGTKWVTTDRCDGTLTTVTEGKVLVALEEAIAELMAQRGRHFDPMLVDAFVAMVPELDEKWPTDAREEDPDVGVLTFDQSTPPGATERIHSRKASPPTRV